MPFSILRPEAIDSQITGTTHEPTTPAGRFRLEEDSDEPIDEDERLREINLVASRISAVTSSLPQNPFNATPNGPLDPNGSGFDPQAWMRTFYALHWQGNETPVKTLGVAFRHLSVHGFGSPTDFQKTVGNVFLDMVPAMARLFGRKGTKIQILQNFEGLVQSGEMLCVLGPPGSGCSTLLKVLAGETHGLFVDDESYLNYQGITSKEMRSQFRGEATYTAEDDSHLPMLSVGDTLRFAAFARSPKHRPGGMSRDEYANHLADVVMAAFGIGHTRNTRVGDNYIRGVSGGERKRVSIAEATLSDAPLQCWDNSTRGLDSANAVEFCRALRLCSDVFGTASAVAIYQAPQAAYDLFDKVVVLYEGRQIYFGKAGKARSYFEDLGFICPDSQTTPDFLTSMTSSSERIIRPGCEEIAPRTPEEFAEAWIQSEDRSDLFTEISEYGRSHTFHSQNLKDFTSARKSEQASIQRTSSPYTLSYFQQVHICLWRGFKLLKGDPTITLVQLGANFTQFLIVGSVFYNLPMTAESLFRRGMVIFNALVLNSIASVLEILTLYTKRPIVEKHNRYALYHPSAEALAAMIVDLPYKVINAIVINITLYFMTNLNRAPGPFFFFLLISFFVTLTMSMLFRFIGSATKTASQALAPTAVIILAAILYTGYSIPVSAMLGWSRWINYLSPLAWAFESLFINELVGRDYPCLSLVPFGPDYEDEPLTSRSCTVIGAEPGSNIVSGTRHLIDAFDYAPGHKWRNFGILLAFLVFFTICALWTSEVVASAKSKGEVLVFPRGQLPSSLKGKRQEDIETSGVSTIRSKIENSEVAPRKFGQRKSVFHWRNVCYDVQIKSETRRILDHVDGWIQPGTLTALMGVSGAGKTTLLDTLASRITMGVITGDMLVDGMPRDESFQRKTGYVQQQDLHLSTATVREALTFSALLRQPASTPKQEKLNYVEEVIDILEMREYANAVIGEIGEGLNVEQRKRLTIGVELAAKPQLLLFLDEPTSGLDSQTSWSICGLMRKLVNHGQAILCTIHQPSALLFERFDRLLLLARGGRTVYFGEIGEQSRVLIEFFTRNGAGPCPQGTNPAEWMLTVIRATTGLQGNIDWPQVWRDSPEKQHVDRELDRLVLEGRKTATISQSLQEEQEAKSEFATSLLQQVSIVTKRIFQQYWRSPSYIYSKAFLGIGSMLFIGFTFFQGNRTQQGLRSQLFGIFALLTTFMSSVEQTIPFFVISRSLYEIRERPSKTYSWKAFMVANIVVEIPWNVLVGTVMFLCWWFPIGLYNNTSVTNTTDSRATLAFLFVIAYMMHVSTFSDLMIAGITSGETAANLANLLGFLTLLFCGILAFPDTLQGFWIFMYRCNPFTYLTEGLLGAGLARAPASCADNEWLTFNAPTNSTCGDYMEAYMSGAGGQLSDPTSTGSCQFCPITNTDAFLSVIGVRYENRWRNLGILLSFIVFNAAGAVFLYWLMRVPKGKRSKKVEKGLSMTTNEVTPRQDETSSTDRPETNTTDHGETKKE